MAAVTTVLSAGVALAGLGMNIAQQSKAKKQQNQAQMAAQQAANRFANLKEENAFANVAVPTLGFELAQQGMERQAMAGIEAAKGAGAEGVIGAVPGIVGAANEANLQLGAQLGEKQYERDLMKAQTGADIEQRRVQRLGGLYASQLEGAQAASAEAEAQRQAAIQGIVGNTTELAGLGGGALHNYLMQNNENYRAKMFGRQQGNF